MFYVYFLATEAISKSNLALESSKELEPEELLENISKIQGAYVYMYLRLVL